MNQCIVVKHLMKKITLHNSISDDWVMLHDISPIFDDDFNSVIEISVSALVKKI